MKVLLAAAAAATALTFSAPALALHQYVGMEFDSRGECESFLKRERNEARRNGTTDPNDFNATVRDRFYCEDNGDGTFTFADRNAS
jgi:hypothetical protein